MNIIITGASGMVGEGVLLTCLKKPEVQKIVVIGRRSCGITHEKLSELLVPNLADLSAIQNHLTGFDACFFCMGVSSIGKSEEQYTKLTYDLTISFAKQLHKASPNLTFCYVSGSGTDSSEHGSRMWARVKGKTENDLQKIGFKAVYNFRPGYLHPIQGQRHVLSGYTYISWLYPILRKFLPSFASSLEELGNAMIVVSTQGYTKPIIEVSDIHWLSKNLATN